MAGITEEMRTKEHAHDYRYFPDPDLMPFEPGEKWLEEVGGRMIELPLARKARLMKEYNLPANDAEVFKSNVALCEYFEGIAKRAKNPKAVANWVINNLQARLAETNARESAEQAAMGLEPDDMKLTGLSDLRFPPDALLELIGLVENKTISSSAAQQVFVEMFDTGRSPAAIVQERGLAQVSDTAAIEAFCDEVIRANPGPVNDFKSGKAAALNFLKGQVMKLSKGKANPTVVGEILERKLKG